MMSPAEILLRLFIGAVLFYFLVWDWAWRLHATAEIADAITAAGPTTLTDDDRQIIRDYFQIMSLFIGNTIMSHAVLGLFLLSRGLFGLSLVVVAVWRIIESVIVTSEKRYTVDLFLVLFGASVFFFCCGLLLHGYNIGFFSARSGNLE